MDMCDKIVGSSPGCVKPKTIQLAYTASLLSTHHNRERATIGWLESGLWGRGSDMYTESG